MFLWLAYHINESFDNTESFYKTTTQLMKIYFLYHRLHRFQLWKRFQISDIPRYSLLGLWGREGINLAKQVTGEHMELRTHITRLSVTSYLACHGCDIRGHVWSKCWSQSSPNLFMANFYIWEVGLHHCLTIVTNSVRIVTNILTKHYSSLLIK